MEKSGGSSLRRLFLVLSALTVIAGAIVVQGVLSGRTGGQWPWSALFHSPTPTLGRVTYAERFTRCGDVVSIAEDVPEDQLATVLSTLSTSTVWKVTQPDNRNVQASRDTDAFCPEHRDFRLIALYGATPGQPPVVCVFRGKRAESAFLLREVRTLTEDDLYKKERDLLRLGVLIGPGTANPVAEDADVDEVVAVYLQGIAEGR